MNARAVGRKLPNPWGLHDMHGNVVEWCRDWYNPQYPGGTDPYVGTDFNNRVTARGGEWRIELRWSRSACRQNLLPAGRGATIGLRLSLQRGNTTQLPPSPTVRLAVISFENRGTSVAHARFGPALAGLVASDLAGFCRAGRPGTAVGAGSHAGIGIGTIGTGARQCRRQAKEIGKLCVDRHLRRHRTEAGGHRQSRSVSAELSGPSMAIVDDCSDSKRN
jgi:hypothetical protein